MQGLQGHFCTKFRSRAAVSVVKFFCSFLTSFVVMDPIPAALGHSHQRTRHKGKSQRARWHQLCTCGRARSMITSSSMAADQHNHDLSDDEDFLFRCEDGLFEAGDDETDATSLRRQRRQLCHKMVEESALVGAAHGCSEFVLRNGSSLRWNPIPGNQQGVAWECSLRLCRVLDERGRRYRRVLELVRLTFFLSSCGHLAVQSDVSTPSSS